MRIGMKGIGGIGCSLTRLTTERGPDMVAINSYVAERR